MNGSFQYTWTLCINEDFVCLVYTREIAYKIGLVVISFEARATTAAPTANAFN